MTILNERSTEVVSKIAYVSLPFAVSLLFLAVGLTLGGVSVALGWFAFVAFNCFTWIRFHEARSPRWGIAPTEDEIKAMERETRRLRREAVVLQARADGVVFRGALFILAAVAIIAILR